MKKRSKINSNPFWWNPVTNQTIPAGTALNSKQKEGLEYFDSVLEFKVFIKLAKKYGKTFITRQLELPLLCGNEIFPPLTWKVDFAVLTVDGLLLFEAKGEWLLHDSFALSDFRKTLRLLKLAHPTYFDNLRLIGETEWKLPGTRLTTVALKDI